jgi:surface polysaccharide O-acyltransferase-like enzyme
MASSDRQNYIDWLRVGAMFLLVFYHTGRLFDYPGWHIKNAELSIGIEAFNRFLDIWLMPLFFLLAGASVWYAFGRRGAAAFAGERTMRLFVPLVFCMLVIVPPQVYVQRIFDGDFTGSFLAWYPNTFHGTYSNDNPATGNLSWHHLWFLAYLYVFSLILIPAFRYFRKESVKGLISRIAIFVEKPGAMYLPVILLAVINIALRPIYGWGNQNLVSDWANFLFYISVFFSGFLMVSDARVIQTVKRKRYNSLIVTITATVLYVLGNDRILPAPGAVVLALNALACWSWLMAIIGFGSRHLGFSNRILRYANEAVLPVYILHQTIIVVLGFYVIKWDTGVMLKYFFIAFTTLLSALAVYEVVRRTVVTRYLFGMKPRRN